MFRRIAVLAATTLVAVLTSGATASAANNFTCSASAGTLQIATAPAVEPITANGAGSPCKTDKGGLANILPAPLGTSALFAESSLTGGDDVRQQTATASAGLADLRILPLPDLGIQPQIDALVAQIPAVSVPLPAPFGTIAVDVRPALAGVLAPKAEVLKLQLAAAYAKAYCGGGKLQLEGSSKLAGLSVLGVELPTDEAVNQTINVLGQNSIDLSQLDLTKLGLPPAVQALVAPIASTIKIPIPELLASVKIVPGAQTRTATSLTQTALGVSIDIAGQPILRLSIGRASVGADSVDCTGAPPRSASEAALQCTNRRLVLIDVLQGQKKVHLYGAADKRYVGKTVRIFFHANGHRVATTKVRQDGTFRVTAKLPRKHLIGTNAARYQARVGKERSRRLKLTRRMIVRQVRVSDGKVRITGRVVKPLAKPVRSIEVRRRVSCKKWQVVKRIKPSRSGAFSTSVDAPDKLLAGTYRFATRVRKNTHNPKTYPTFTLPRYVDLT